MDDEHRDGLRTPNPILLAVLSLALLALPALAQDGSVSGTVYDREGGALPGVTVSLQNADGQDIGKSTQTDAAGGFRIDGLADGAYTATAVLQGFRSSSESVEVAGGGAASVDFALGLSVVEQIVVQGELGEENVLRRPMTVTGFNEGMVVELGMNNNNDLEALTPGLQIGHQSPDSGHGNHLYLRGIGSQRNQEFFQATAVATYVDGIYTDELYGLEPGNLFDVESMNVARGPQGTTGGRAAIAGAISFNTIKPTAQFDVNALAEYTDQTSQRGDLAIGGPIGDSRVSWRLTAGSWQGEGAQPNIGPGGDYDEPDNTHWAPQLRYLGETVDFNVRYAGREDSGAPRTSVELTGRDVTTECLLDGTDPEGNPTCLFPNPFLGAANQAPSVRDCDLNDPNQLICDGDDLRNVVDYNTPGNEDSELQMAVADLNVRPSQGLSLSYKAGYRETTENAQTDTDGTSRMGGPSDPFLDANGYPFSDTMTNYYRYSEQTSHEVRLASSFASDFQFVLGAYQRDGDEPYDARFFDFSNPAFNTNTLATCQAALPFFGLPLLSDFGTTSAQSGQGGVWACPGELLDWSNAGAIGAYSDGNMNGHWLDFYGHSRFETRAYYGNVEYQLGDKWTLFGGIRHDQDIKTHVQNDVRIGLDFGFGVDLWIFRNASVEGFEGKNDAEWNQTTWNAGFQYSANPASMWYGRVSKGGRPGGFVGFGNMTEVTFDSEELINYEGGWKGLLADNRLQLEAAVFYNDYQGYWINSNRLLPVERRIPGESIFEGEMNTVDGSWINGLELTAAYRATDRFTIRGWYNYLDSEIGDFATTYCCDPAAPTETVEFQDREGNTFTQEIASLTNFGGNQMPLQPKHKFSLTAIYDMGNLRFLGTLGHTTDKNTDISNLPKYKIPEYTRLDLRAIWFTPREGLQVHVFAKNVLDQIAVQQWRPNEGYGFGSGVIRGSLTDEREVGVTASFRLGGRKTLYGLGGGMGPSAGGK